LLRKTNINTEGCVFELPHGADPPLLASPKASFHPPEKAIGAAPKL
jgi:hypothetical protein